MFRNHIQADVHGVCDVQKVLCTQGSPRPTEAVLRGAVLGHIALHKFLEAFSATRRCWQLLRGLSYTRMALVVDHACDGSAVPTEGLRQCFNCVASIVQLPDAENWGGVNLGIMCVPFMQFM